MFSPCMYLSTDVLKGVKPIVNQSSMLGAAILNIVRNNYYARSSTSVCLVLDCELVVRTIVND